MSVIAFHRILISAAIVFCAFFSAWEWGRYRSDGDPSNVILGVVFAVLTVALCVYLAFLGRFLGRKDAR